MDAEIIEATSARFTKTTDACFAWITNKYGRAWQHAVDVGAPPTPEDAASVHLLRQSIADDVSACDEQRWSRFSIPLHHQQPHHQQHAVLVKEAMNPSPSPMVIEDARCSSCSISASSSCRNPLLVEPSRHIFRYARKRQEHLYDHRVSPAVEVSSRNNNNNNNNTQLDPPPPPSWLDGYVREEDERCAGEDACHFLLYPSRHAPPTHNNGAEEVSTYVAGRLRVQHEGINPSTPVQVHHHHHHNPRGRWSDATSLVMNVAHKFSFRQPHEPPRMLHLLRMDAVHVNLRVNDQHVEHHQGQNTTTSSQHVCLREDGLSCTINHRNPRYSTNLHVAAFSPVESSSTPRIGGHGGAHHHLGTSRGRIFSFSVSDIFSTARRLHTLTQRWHQWTKHNNNSTHVVGDDDDDDVRCGWRTVATPGLEISSMDHVSSIFARLYASSWLQLPLPLKMSLRLHSDVAWMLPLSAHQLLWATQGPLIDGQQQHQRLGHRVGQQYRAERWAAAWRAELRRRGGGATTFAELCVADDATQPWHTSMGVAWSSIDGRQPIPHEVHHHTGHWRLECAVNWLSHKSSPTSERNWHLRCGITWRHHVEE